MRAVIAGSGALPVLFAKLLKDKYHQPIFVLGITDNWNPDDFRDFQSDEIDIGNFRTGMDILKKNQCDELILVGKIQRDAAHYLQKDDITQKIFNDISGKGDDHTVRAISQMLKNYGFTITAPQEIFPELICETIGTLGAVHPDEQHLQDIKRGKDILQILSPADVGQAIVVHQGLVLGIEAIEGTNALIARTERWQISGSGAVLVKLPKIGQTHLMDLPVIGFETVKNASDHHFSGIAIQKNGALFINHEDSIAYADAHQLFIHVLE